MMKRQYHCLISGLPDLAFDLQKELISVAEFKEALSEQLHPDDFEQVRLLFLPKDNTNLVRFMEGRELNEMSGENYTQQDFEEQLSQFSAILPSDDLLPSYMVGVMRDQQNENGDIDPIACSHQLANGYYDHLMQHGCEFLRSYAAFNHSLENLLTFLQSGKHGLDPKRFITGTSEHSIHLRQIESNVLQKDPEFEFFDEIISLSEIASFSASEEKIDLLRWKVIDELLFFEDFTIDRIIGYLQKMFIIERWSDLKRVQGEEKLRKIIERTKQENISAALLKAEV